MTSPVKKTILVDQDNCIADFDAGVVAVLAEEFLESVSLFKNRKEFHITDENYPDQIKNRVQEIIHRAGFIKNLPVIDGAVDALKEMTEHGHTVFICTSPLYHYENSVLEKYMWVEKHLGKEWTRRLVLTKDKTAVRGDILIDDKPEVEGVYAPEWEHVVFDAPYNREVKEKKRLLNWNDWQLHI